MSARRARHARQRGFTLVELMVALVVSGIVMLGIFAFSSVQRTNASAHERNVMMQQALEGAMWSIGQDVRQAGLGFTRTCTELRVWDAATSQLVNPGAGLPADAVVDPVTGERYWVLRDGLQGHWRSGGAVDAAGAADSFDVIAGEANYLGNVGVFTIDGGIDGAATALTLETAPGALDSTNPAHLAQVQQLFPPGTFVVVAARPGAAVVPFSPTAHSQCLLLQVTDDVQPGAETYEWSLPIGGTSGFNQGLATMVGNFNDEPPACTSDALPVGCGDDWQADTLSSVMVVPVGRLRWSRYEIDYSIPALPYLVRYDIIGFQAGDLEGLGGVDYPHCAAGSCTAPQLHLPGSDSPPAAVAIGPMIEDLQIAVGCDGWSQASSDALSIRYPDGGFEELGPAEGPLAGLPNHQVDENRTESGQRGTDEWLGNALEEQSAPDCVNYGSAEYNRDAWAALESDPGPPFRMSPQTVRITLVASTEGDEGTGGLAIADLPAIEDRPAIPSLVGVRQRFTLTERYTPDNLRWRDPRLQ
ncbi:MAG: prepilin-type N-terminal cleavage/methylation domain-containing protein [Deltaproteobacteria bacterium]|nr:prepilin-type N-terminal cleavage/methylation domain-containing protein [Deltaproteobacteria bacterium]